MNTTETKPLTGKVAVVAGATRGGGRGIARMLGEAGATVCCTGRSVRGSLASGDHRPETIEETARLVTEAGGTGLWARVDHTQQDEVRAFFERLSHEQGRLDVLVNNVWGGDALTQWGQPFWELDLGQGFTMLERALHSHVITSRYGVPLMVEAGRGLVVEITDGLGTSYRGNLFYDLVKASVGRLAYAMSHELAGRGVTALAVTPGFLRSEHVLDHFGVTEKTWRDATRQDPHFAHSETPSFVGRAVAALAADDAVAAKAGRVHSSWDLAREYGFDDEDGRRPDWGAHLQAVVSEALVRLAGRGGLPVVSAGDRQEALSRLRQAVRKEFDDVGLAFYADTRDDSFYERLLDLGPQPDEAAISDFVARNLW